MGAFSDGVIQDEQETGRFRFAVAEALRLGVLPVPSWANVRAKTITLFIVAREVVPEEVAREIARQDGDQ
jgi:hypothetical protein